MSVRRLAPPEQQPASFAFSAENESWAERQIAKYPEGRQASAVIPLLWQAQLQSGGWLPQKAIEAVAEKLGMPIIRVMEVASFYTMFNLKPVGRYFIQLCGTVPCHLVGALDLKQALLERIGDQEHVTEDGMFSWLEVECLGACCNAPMVQINTDYYEDLTPELLNKLMDDLAAGRPVKTGSQIGRISSEPQDAVDTLTDPALFDGSLNGTWRQRFETADVVQTGEAAATTQDVASSPKAARPDAGRATERPVSETPASRAQNGETPVSAKDQRDASDPSRSTKVEPGMSAADKPAPESSKSYTGTPSKPEDGRTASGPAAETTPVSGPPVSPGEEEKRPGAERDVSPGVPPKEP